MRHLVARLRREQSVTSPDVEDSMVVVGVVVPPDRLLLAHRSRVARRGGGTQASSSANWRGVFRRAGAACTDVGYCVAGDDTKIIPCSPLDSSRGRQRYSRSHLAAST